MTTQVLDAADNTHLFFEAFLGELSSSEDSLSSGKYPGDWGSGDSDSGGLLELLELLELLSFFFLSGILHIVPLDVTIGHMIPTPFSDFLADT